MFVILVPFQIFRRISERSSSKSAIPQLSLSLVPSLILAFSSALVVFVFFLDLSSFCWYVALTQPVNLIYFPFIGWACPRDRIEMVFPSQPTFAGHIEKLSSKRIPRGNFFSCDKDYILSGVGMGREKCQQEIKLKFKKIIFLEKLINQIKN